MPPTRSLLALLILGLVVGSAAAQDQGYDREANEAALAWQTETDTAKKVALGKELIARYPGRKGADSVAGAVYNDKAFSAEQKAEIARAYYEAHSTNYPDRQYVEYSLGLWATSERDPARQYELAKRYMQEYPGGTFTQYVSPLIFSRRAELFKKALKDNNINEALKYAQEAWAEGQTGFYYTHELADYARRDLMIKGGKSPLLEQAVDWAERAITYLESDRYSWGCPTPRVNKPEMLASLYQLRGYAEFLMTATRSQQATADDYNQAVAALQKSAEINPKDISTHYYLGQVYNAQYVYWAQRFLTYDTPEKQQTPEAQEVLAKLNAAADAVIAA